MAIEQNAGMRLGQLEAVGPLTTQSSHARTRSSVAPNASELGDLLERETCRLYIDRRDLK
ncbi:MAG: hypothetical protein EOP20_14735 [Hyphomicrobiales bacterium]|nr:MAG: hypothetical protein EOP20_14735 [Hyphomicrobiales bacterium]